ncbi:MAG TPA: hypothetical protein PLL75_01110 [Candidatus Omnitrophota bacterium]|nr:hypothetical protein [Candidatus Omnitrophota bacterium]HPS36313.1 hypothetical protein [Candidatus Omnitrophota bacterium]
MGSSFDRFLRIREFLSRYGFLIFSVLYLILAFRLLPDYGLGFDSPKNFSEGEINLNYLLTHYTLPDIDQFNLSFQIHGALFFMIGEACRQVFSQWLGWIDPVSARHAFLPFLTLLFLNVYYNFLKKRTGPFFAAATCLTVLTYPHFFGHSFNNIKDIPLFVFFSVSVLLFYEWAASGFRGLRWLYACSTALGISLAGKLYTLIAPGIIALWLITSRWMGIPLPEKSENPEKEPAPFRWSRERVFHVCAAILIAAAIAAFFFMPGFYGIEEKARFWRSKSKAVKDLLGIKNKAWSFYPLIQIFYVTPALTLLAATWGILKTWLRRSRHSLDLLMMIWLGTVIGIACSPLLPVYNGIRLFMTYLVPFSYFATGGILDAGERIATRFSLKKSWLGWELAAMVIGAQLFGILTTHPYETAFFNFFAGGLKGAQEKNIPDAGDFWLTSYREGIAWVNRHAPRNSFLLVPNPNSFLMVEYYNPREDIRYDFVRRRILPRNSFLLMVPNKASWQSLSTSACKDIEDEMKSMIKVYEIKRQGGEISTIYYKP